MTYLTWEISARDGTQHAVQLDFRMSSQLVVNTAEQPVTWDRPAVEGFTVLRVGSRTQRVLARRGDDLRIDWGYAYLASPTAQTPAIIGDGAFRFDLGQVGEQPVTRRVLLAYDDLYSIKYFGTRLRPYWRRSGAQAADLFRIAQRLRRAGGTVSGV